MNNIDVIVIFLTGFVCIGFYYIWLALIEIRDKKNKDEAEVLDAIAKLKASDVN